MYSIVSRSAMPTMSPPTTAPSGLSNPPSAAAANAKHEHRLHEAGVEARALGGRPARRRARRARRPAPSRASACSPVLMPTSRLDSGLVATARNARPSRVLLEEQVEQHALGDQHRRREPMADLVIGRRRTSSLGVAGTIGGSGFGVGAEDRPELGEGVDRQEQAERDDDDGERAASPARPAGSRPAR